MRMRPALLLAGLGALLGTLGCPGNATDGPDAGPDASDLCGLRCLALESCPEILPERCRLGCEMPAARTCLEGASSCLVGAECVAELRPPPVRAFEAGPHGGQPRDRAGPFVLPTLAGDWDFEKEWTGEDSHLFLFHATGYAYSEQLWSSDPAAFLSAAPENVHLYFLAYPEPDGGDRAVEWVTDARVRVELALAALPFETQRNWRARIHYVTTLASQLEGWLGETLRARPVFALAVDPHQRLREVGMLSPPQGPPELRFLANEARYFAFEERREAALVPADTEIVVADAVETANEHRATITLPDAATMASFDRMEIDLELACPGHLDANCGEWDYLAYLQLCEAADGACPTELGRFITPYRREGRWVTDASWALALLTGGGVQHLRFTAPTQPGGTVYVVSIKLRLLDSGSDLRPVQAVPLFTGGPFDEGYNALHPPVSIDLAELPPRAEVVLLLTGHGFGQDRANCAEFCNHTHTFQVNGGGDLEVTHPWVGDSEGCLKQVDEGVVPNQFGTWPYGRGGWCPGLEVAPHTFEVTSLLQTGANAFRYEAGLDGQPYTPVPAPNPSGFGGRIDLASWLVVYGPKNP